MEKSSSRPDADLQEGLSALLECQRVVRVANPALVAMGPVTYHAGFRVLDDKFSGWLHSTFQQEILPGLVEAVRLGSDEKGRELLECDARILRHASPLLRNGSGRAGRLLLQQGVPSGVKCLHRLQEAARSDKTGSVAAHLATVFGARCGIFSIGQRPAALAYVYLELRTGAPDWHDGPLQEKLADAAEVIGSFFRKKHSANPGADALFPELRSHG